MLKTSIAGLAVMLAAGCVMTDHEEMTVAEGAQEECRSITDSGSIIPRRVCHNKATWAAIDERDREVAQETMGTIQGRWTPPPRDGGF